jgi:hypothetical protein
MTILEFAPEKSSKKILSAIILHNYLSKMNQSFHIDPEVIRMRELRNEIVRRDAPRAANVRAHIFRDRFVDLFARDRAFNA